MQKTFQKKHFITGLILSIPIWITVYIIWLFIKLVSTIAKPFIIAVLQILNFPINPFISTTISFVISLLIIYFIGLIANTILGKNVLKKIEFLITKIPLINDIYLASKKLVHFFTEYKGIKGNKVVIVEYPRKGIYCLGIVTIETEDKLGVFIPSTPNPTTGYLIFFTKEEAKLTSLSVEDALRIIVSGGIAVDSEIIKKYL